MNIPAISFQYSFLIALIIGLFGLIGMPSWINNSIVTVLFVWWIISLISWLIVPDKCNWVISNRVGEGDKPIGWPFYYPGEGSNYWGYTSADLKLFDMKKK